MTMFLLGAPPPIKTLAQLQADHVARAWGLFLHFNMATFHDIEQADPLSNPNTFNPTALNIDQWVTTAQAMKAKYACLTVKHSDGFCLWPSLVTPHNISASSWYKTNGNTDIVKQYVDKFNGAGIAPYLYFCIVDGTLTNLGLTTAQQKAYLQNQITELLTNYGSIKGIWLDRGAGSVTLPWANNTELTTFIHSLQQAQCLSMVNDQSHANVSSDIVEYEAGTVGAQVPASNVIPSESVDTIRNDANWFWKSFTSTHKTAAALLTQLNYCKANGATFMINAGPDNTGNIPADQAAILATVGQSL